MSKSILGRSLVIVVMVALCTLPLANTAAAATSQASSPSSWTSALWEAVVSVWESLLGPVESSAPQNGGAEWDPVGAN